MDTFNVKPLRLTFNLFKKSKQALKRQFIWGEFLLKDNEGFQYIKLI